MVHMEVTHVDGYIPANLRRNRRGCKAAEVAEFVGKGNRGKRLV